MSHYRKAVVGALLASLTALGTAVVDDAVTWAEAVGVVVAGVSAFVGVYSVPNAPISSFARRVRRSKS